MLHVLYDIYDSYWLVLYMIFIIVTVGYMVIGKKCTFRFSRVVGYIVLYCIVL